MPKTETLEEFYQHKFDKTPGDLKMDTGHFNVFNMEDIRKSGTTPKYARRDFYKISLLRGENIFHYADKSLEVSGSTLMFFNPLVPYKFERVDEESTGYFCIFKEAFFSDHIRSQVKYLPMFVPGANAVYNLNAVQDEQSPRYSKKSPRRLPAIILLSTT